MLPPVREGGTETSSQAVPTGSCGLLPRPQLPAPAAHSWAPEKFRPAPPGRAPTSRDPRAPARTRGSAPGPPPAPPSPRGHPHALGPRPRAGPGQQRAGSLTSPQLVLDSEELLSHGAAVPAGPRGTAAAAALLLHLLPLPSRWVLRGDPGDSRPPAPHRSRCSPRSRVRRPQNSDAETSLFPALAARLASPPPPPSAGTASTAQPNRPPAPPPPPSSCSAHSQQGTGAIGATTTYWAQGARICDCRLPLGNPP